MNERGNAHSTRLECSSCGSVSLTPDDKGRLVCDYCHTIHVLPEHACSECGTMHAPDARYCPACGADLVHECRSCGTSNPRSARKCTECGHDLDMLNLLFARTTKQRADWLQEVRTDAATLKAQQEEVSKARREDMWARERRRRADLAQMRAKRDRQHRIMFTALGLIIAAIIIGVGIAIATAMIRTPAPPLYPF